MQTEPYSHGNFRCVKFYTDNIGGLSYGPDRIIKFICIIVPDTLCACTLHNVNAVNAEKGRNIKNFSAGLIMCLCSWACVIRYDNTGLVWVSSVSHDLYLCLSDVHWRISRILTYPDVQVVRCLLIEPNPESALNEDAARLFMEVALGKTTLC